MRAVARDFQHYAIAYTIDQLRGSMDRSAEATPTGKLYCYWMHSSPQASTVLKRLIDGYQVSQALYVAATLGIADLLIDGPLSADELATAVGAHPRSLYRLLRALASVGVFGERVDQRFALTPVGDNLRLDAPQPLAGWAAFIGRPYHWQAWANLLHSVRTGETAFNHVHGVSGWEYRAHDLEELGIFDRAMTELSRRASLTALEASNFARFGTVVDVGGGRGAFLAALLARYPNTQGVLFDQPQVVAMAKPVLQAAGVADRCRVVGGSFFDSVPGGGDAYLLKAVLHDWDDERAIAILRVCRGAIPPHAALLVIEREVGPVNEGRDGKLSDLEMLVGNGGQERTTEEYGALFLAAGFRLVDTTPAGSRLCIIQAAPVV